MSHRLRITYMGRVLGHLIEPGRDMWSLHGRLEPADPGLFAELLRLVQEDTGPADEDDGDEPSRRWDIDIRVEVEGRAHELIELRPDGIIELKALPTAVSSP